MERVADCLTYEGSTPDAVLKAKASKKLLMVYISVEDHYWLRWEQSTFGDPVAMELISKYCVFLHLRQGSLDASQFSATHHLKAPPSISIVGYTGVLLWHESCFMDRRECYFDDKSLVKNILMAWATLNPLDRLEQSDAASETSKEVPSSVSSDVPHPVNKDGGFFRHAKWVLSYVNPFTCFGSEAAPNEWSSTIQNQLPRLDSSSLNNSPNQREPHARRQC